MVFHAIGNLLQQNAMHIGLTLIDIILSLCLAYVLHCNELVLVVKALCDTLLQRDRYLQILIFLATYLLGIICSYSVMPNGN